MAERGTAGETKPVAGPRPPDTVTAHRPKGDPVDLPELTDLQHAILDHEVKTWRLDGSKTQSIRDTFLTEHGLTETAYYRDLNRLCDNPAALAAHPMLINRLCRLRAKALRSW